MFLNSKDHPYQASLWHIMWNWQRSAVQFFLLSALIVASIYHYELIDPKVQFPSFPLAVIGGALGIFVSFRTNSAYQRWWEGRKLWGRMINTSRHLCTQAVAYLPAHAAQEIVHRHITYVHVLRCGLRGEGLAQDAHILRSVNQLELDLLKSSTNPNHALLNLQLKRLVELREQKEISEFYLSDMDASLRHLLDIQGGTERIKKTPFPPAYGFLAEQLTKIYACLLPIALFHHLSWWVVPVNILVCMCFQMVNEVGRVLENPFEDIWPALPLTAMSLTIERNLRQALNETELPDAESVQHAGNSFVLM